MVPSSESVIIIAEIGECYNGSLDVARRLIDAAQQAGCDYVKFQTLDIEGIGNDDPEREWFLKIALTEERIDHLISIAQAAGIAICFTPENPKTASRLYERGLGVIKLASSSLIDAALQEYVASHFDRVFFSTGMGTLDEVAAAVERLEKVQELFILHCVSEYPTGPLLAKEGLRALRSRDVHLNMMRMLALLFPRHQVGFSDHTDGVLAPIAAVAAGAKVIEKHVTLDRSTPIRNYRERRDYLGTDHVLSLEPDELKRMVAQIREIETMLGDWRWERSEGEKLLKDYLRSRFQSPKDVAG
jgi:N,N'-diacetyllegionaminate synthase